MGYESVNRNEQKEKNRLREKENFVFQGCWYLCFSWERPERRTRFTRPWWPWRWRWSTRITGMSSLGHWPIHVLSVHEKHILYPELGCKSCSFRTTRCCWVHSAFPHATLPFLTPLPKYVWINTSVIKYTCLSLSLSLSHTHTRTHARTHARTHTHTHIHTHTSLGWQMREIFSQSIDK